MGASVVYDQVMRLADWDAASFADGYVPIWNAGTGKFRGTLIRLAIGSTITDATPSKMLYVDAAGKLANGGLTVSVLGVVSATTPADGDDSTQVATTAFVTAAVNAVADGASTAITALTTALAMHAALTTNVHGITNTAQLPYLNVANAFAVPGTGAVSLASFYAASASNTYLRTGVSSSDWIGLQKDAAGTGYVDTTGDLVLKGVTTVRVIERSSSFVFASFSTTGNILAAYDASATPLTVQLAASQTANAVEVKNSSGTNVFSISPDGLKIGTGSNGRLAIGGGFLQAGIQATGIGNNVTATGPASVGFGYNVSALADRSTALGHASASNYAASIALGASASTTAANQLMIGSSSYPLNEIVLASANPTFRMEATTNTFVVKLAASHAANAFEIRNSSGLTLMSVDKNGLLSTGGNGVSGQVSFVGTNGLVSGLIASDSGNVTVLDIKANSQVNFSTTGGGALTIGSTSAVTWYPGGMQWTFQPYDHPINFEALLPGVCPLVVKGAASHTASLQEWQNSSGGVLAYIASNGAANLGGLTVTGSTSLDYLAVNAAIPSGGTVIIGTRTADVSGLQVRAIASQTAPIQEWQNSSGSVYAKVDASGIIYASSGGGGTGGPLFRSTQYATGIGHFASDTALQFWQAGVHQAAMYSGFLAFGSSGGLVWTASTPYANGDVGITRLATRTLGINGGNWKVIAGNAGEIPLVVQAAASPSVNVTEWQNSSGTVLTSVLSTGNLLVNGNATAGVTIATTGTLGSGGRSILQLTNTAGLAGWDFGVTGLSSTDFRIRDLTSVSQPRFVVATTTGYTGVYTTTPGAQLHVTASTASTIGQIIDLAASASGDGWQLRNSSGTVLTNFTAAGNLVFNVNGTSTVSNFTGASIGFTNQTCINLSCPNGSVQVLSGFSSGSDPNQVILNVAPSGGNTSTGGCRIVYINPTWTQLGSGNNYLLDVAVNSARRVSIGPRGETSIIAGSGVKALVVKPLAAATVTNKVLTSNVATLTTAAAHGFLVGDSVTVAAVDATFNGTYTVTSVPSTTTFTYSKTASNVGSQSATGTATPDQTGNLQEWQNSSSTILSKFDASGNLGIGMGTTALTTPLTVAVGSGFGNLGVGVYQTNSGTTTGIGNSSGSLLLFANATVAANISQAAYWLVQKDTQLGFADSNALGSAVHYICFARVDNSTIKVVKDLGSTLGSIQVDTVTATTIIDPVTTPAQITADQNNYASAAGAFQEWTTDASRSITGMVAGTDGEVREIWNAGSFNIVFVNESASSTAANRFHNASGTDITVAPGECVTARYSASLARWRLF